MYTKAYNFSKTNATRDSWWIKMENQSSGASFTSDSDYNDKAKRVAIEQLQQIYTPLYTQDVCTQRQEVA